MDFSTRVFEIVKRIPRGRVATYGEIARALNTRACRAVGQALKKNRNPQVPCHRVIKSSGKIGGFRGNQTREKARILRSEGIEIRGNRIDLKKYFYRFSD